MDRVKIVLEVEGTTADLAKLIGEAVLEIGNVLDHGVTLISVGTIKVGCGS